MATLLIIASGHVEEVPVQEDFDTALEMVFPLSPPSSALEARSTQTFHLAPDGERTYIPASTIARVTE